VSCKRKKKLKCKCGNEQGKALVKPAPVSFFDVKTKQEVFIYFMAGFVTYPDGTSECYFCYAS
jgi:hypothetical protein